MNKQELINKANGLELRIRELTNYNHDLARDLLATKALLINEEGRIEYFIKEISRLSNQVVDLLETRDSLESDLKALSDFMNKTLNSMTRSCGCCGNHTCEINVSDNEGVSTWYYDCDICGFEFLDAELTKVNKILQINGK